MVNCYAGLSEREFRKWRESTQITPFVIPNTSSCHSEHREESRGITEGDSSLRSE